MPSSFIPQRLKRAKQQITVKPYQDQLAMLDSYGRFIDDSRDYIISQARIVVQKRPRIRTVESRNLVSFVVSTALGLYLFHGWPFPVENNVLQMVLLQKPCLLYGIK